MQLSFMTNRIHWQFVIVHYSAGDTNPLLGTETEYFVDVSAYAEVATATDKMEQRRE